MNLTAINLAKKYESCRLTAYQDQVGKWTIGWGSTGPDIVQGTVWTQEQADFRLGVDMQKAENATRELIDRALSETALGALIDFTYNLGPGALATSSVLRPAINNGNDIGAAKAFIAFDHAGGIEAKGLLRRRLDEAITYLNGVN